MDVGGELSGCGGDKVSGRSRRARDCSRVRGERRRGDGGGSLDIPEGINAPRGSANLSPVVRAAGAVRRRLALLPEESRLASDLVFPD